MVILSENSLSPLVRERISSLDINKLTLIKEIKMETKQQNNNLLNVLNEVREAGG